MIYQCTGTDNLRPTLTLKTCPVCGGEIELFSTDRETACDNCGFVAYNDTKTCIQWCQYTRFCVGDDLYRRFAKGNESPPNSG